MSGYRQCSVCVMDTSAPDIRFDEAGRCNYCRDFEALLERMPSLAEREAVRDSLIAEIKRRGRGHDYDCIVGVSGGADSSYVLYQTVQHGLRPLAVHLDNGWNSELASHNIASLVTKLGVDLHTHVIDWEENRDLQRSFFAANVIDIELLMDNAMIATNYAAARRWRLKYILSGMNSTTEGMLMPGGWNHHKWDATNIRAIQRRHGTRRIKTHPLYSIVDYVLDKYVRKIRWVSFLDLFDYRKAEAIKTLVEAVGYRPYPYKHYESVFTRFYQGYILPNKFGIDKRRLHLSSLIISGQESRDHALDLLAQDPYPDPVQLRDDRQFVLKKLGFSDEQFATYIAAPAIPHAYYPSELKRMRWLSSIYRVIARSYRSL